MSAWEELLERVGKGTALSDPQETVVNTPNLSVPLPPKEGGNISAWERLFEEVNSARVKAGKPPYPVPNPSVPLPPPTLPSTQKMESSLATAEIVDNVPRRADGKRKYLLDYLPTQLFKAARFSASMIAKGESPGIAHAVAARHYKADKRDVARYCGQYAGTISGRKR